MNLYTYDLYTFFVETKGIFRGFARKKSPVYHPIRSSLRLTAGSGAISNYFTTTLTVLLKPLALTVQK